MSRQPEIVHTNKNVIKSNRSSDKRKPVLTVKPKHQSNEGLYTRNAAIIDK
jgi:hypothetical protein